MDIRGRFHVDTGMPFGRGMFRARRGRGRRKRRSFIPRPRFQKQVIRTTHFNIAPTQIGFGASSNVTLLRTPATIDEDPDHTIVSNGSTIGEIAENSRIIKTDLQLDISSEADNTPFACTAIFWKDDIHGAVTQPTVGSILVPATTQALATTKKSIMMFKRFLFTTNADKRTIFLRIPPRFRTLRHGESYNLLIVNDSAAADITFMLSGRLWSAGA